MISTQRLKEIIEKMYHEIIIRNYNNFDDQQLLGLARNMYAWLFIHSYSLNDVCDKLGITKEEKYILGTLYEYIEK